MKMINRKLQDEVKLNNARFRNREFMEQKKAKALHKLVRWDEYRVKKAEVIELYYAAR